MSKFKIGQKVKKGLGILAGVIVMGLFLYYGYFNTNSNNLLNIMQANPYTVYTFLSALGDTAIEKLDQGSLQPTCKYTLDSISNGKEKVQSNDIMDMLQGKTEGISRSVVEYAGNCANKILSQMKDFPPNDEDFNEKNLMGTVLLEKCKNIQAPIGASSDDIYFIQMMCIGIAGRWEQYDSTSFTKCKKYVNRSGIDPSIIYECSQQFFKYMFELQKDGSYYY